MQLFEINENEAGQRFDKYLKKKFSQAPAGFLYKMLRKKNIVLNGKKADGSEKLAVADQIKVFLSDETIEKFSGSSQVNKQLSEKYPVAELDILYEDKDILVINKPSGMLSQKAKTEDISANEYIIGYLLKSHALTPEELNTFKPSICNRLDRNTTGILIAGKTLTGLQNMSEQLKQRSLSKYYCCLVRGAVTEMKEITGWLTKDSATNQVTISKKEMPGSSYIRTGYRPLEVMGSYTLLEVDLITGRSHQIRAHLASIGHPIVGDTKYGNPAVNQEFLKSCGIKSQLLHACRMEVADGITIEAPLPESFERALTYVKGKNGNELIHYASR